MSCAARTSRRPAHLPTVRRARKVLATYSDMEELIRLGAYRAGSSPEVDEAVALMPDLTAFLGPEAGNAGREERQALIHRGYKPARRPSGGGIGV